MFQMRMEKVTVHNGQSISAETIGTWKAGLESNLNVKDTASLANLSAVTIYRVVTVPVSNDNSSPFFSGEIFFDICLKRTPGDLPIMAVFFFQSAIKF